MRGFLMGAADIVPGVSGGTVALIVGIYERLVRSVRAGSSALGRLLRGDIAGFRHWVRSVEWSFIIPLGVGIVVAIFALAGVLESLLHDLPEEMAGLFSGLIAGSVVIAWPLVRHWSARRIGVLIGVAIGVFVLLGVREGITEDTVTQVLDPAIWAFFFAGAIAICAMILPGVSGSFLLVLLGMYGRGARCGHRPRCRHPRGIRHRNGRRARLVHADAQLGTRAPSRHDDGRADRIDGRLDAGAVAVAERAR